ncbi:dapper homolog 1-like isoform X2 [Melanotaenia boesemani]|uniref:dapper homolog 1-like isoform X2 n=1 Tax=Melanotaenia boesemani TaxID=1250792 RepID=UPI001C04D705|nr:dapper homolog 1-like isoform X2 [Melanotaenia boesemani]
MFCPELPDCLGVRFPALCAPKAERSRNKERLEASLAALYELELLRQRQESRVRGALCSGDSLSQPWEALRPQLCVLNAPQDGLKLQTGVLQHTHTGVRSSLEQQVGELKVNSEVRRAEPTELEDKQLSSEVHEVKENGSPELNSEHEVTCSFLPSETTGEPKRKEMWLPELARQVIVSDALGKIRDTETSQQADQGAPKLEMFISGLSQRQALPTRPSKPRTSLAHDAKSVSGVRQGSFSRKDEHLPSNKVSLPDMSTPSQCLDRGASQDCHKLDQEQYQRIGYAEDALSPYHHQLHQTVQHQLGLYHKPRHTSMMNTPQSVSFDYPSSRVPQAHRYSSTAECDSPQHFSKYPSPAALTKSSSPEEQLVSAEYIPAQPCQASTRTYAHHLSSPNRGSEGSKPSKSRYSPERDHHQDQVQHFRSSGGQKKCRLNEDRSGFSRKAGKKASRSHSQSSLQRLPERRYNTVERDAGGSGSFGKGDHNMQSKSKKQQPGSSSSRRWQSTLDLSQDSLDQPARQASVQNAITSNQREHFSRRTRKPHQTHAASGYHPHLRHYRHKESTVERHQLGQPNMDYTYPGQGPESDSTMSEADSPDSTSLSSDSDESGALVWPQQLPPQLSLPSPPASSDAPLQPKAFVKIKASHALKKKILRFRTGSLKLMTTV